MSSALDGLRVLDLADRSAALTGRILADLGAEVIMVESPDGNSIRRLAPFLDDLPANERSFAHQYYSANKRSVVLEHDDPRFDLLVASADVVIDTGPTVGRNLAHHHLRALNPDLIQCSITPFGLRSPWAGRKATDLVAGAAGGLVWLSGESTGRPVQGGSDPSYAMAGLCAASAVSIALHAGAGAHIDLSLQEATVMAAMQTANPSIWTWRQRIPRRPGLSNALRCADGGYVGLLVRPDRFEKFLAWCDHVGIEHGMTSDDWEWARLDAPRKGNPVAAATLALAAALSRDEFAEGALEIADIVCLPVLGFDDLEKTEQYTVNDQFLAVEHPSLNPLARPLGFVRSPVDAMADGVEISAAPLLGQHQSLVDAVLLEPRPAVAALRPDPPQPDPAQALAGLRVVDFGWVLAAPIGTRILASFGAEVIRVESAAKPDSMRSQLGPDGTPDVDLGGLFNSVNAGKLSLSVDLSTKDGLALIKDLIATADVVVNNFRPGAMERMGLGFEVLRALKDDIVLLNLPGAHRRGPWAVRASMGNILMAASGFNMLTGFDHERPRGIGVAYPDFTSPHLLTATILAALRQRDAGAGGQELQLTQLSGVISLLGAEWMQYKATGVAPARKANRDPNYCPHGVYPAVGSDHSEDEWVALAVAGELEWERFCQLLDKPELQTDARFATHELRKQNEDALDHIVDVWTVTQDKWEAADRLQAVGIAAAAVEHLADTHERDPQLVQHYQVVNQPSAPDVDIPIDREAAQWVGADHRLRRSPGLGEHNEFVVRELLGRSEEEYLSLVVDEVLG